MKKLLISEKDKKKVIISKNSKINKELKRKKRNLINQKNG
jgi:hypothetical protein